jgi:hypothetical protein
MKLDWKSIGNEHCNYEILQYVSSLFLWVKLNREFIDDCGCVAARAMWLRRNEDSLSYRARKWDAVRLTWAPITWKASRCSMCHVNRKPPQVYITNYLVNTESIFVLIYNYSFFRRFFSFFFDTTYRG